MILMIITMIIQNIATQPQIGIIILDIILLENHIIHMMTQKVKTKIHIVHFTQINAINNSKNLEIFNLTVIIYICKNNP